MGHNAIGHLIEMMLRLDTYLPEQLNIYECLHCGYLHVGHEPTFEKGRGAELAKAQSRARLGANPVLEREENNVQAQP
jgi:hypothetical protein